jgi:O-antigen/teichoic acid export membrane protein
LEDVEVKALNGVHIIEDSLKKRYLFKLGTNLFGFVTSLATQAIITRGLGPIAFGNFNFLTNIFQQIFGFLDMGTSVCFYTKLSQRQNDFGLVSFYLYFSFFISLLVLAFVAFTHACYIYSRVWPDQNIYYIYLAAIWGILTWFSGVVFNRMADAYGLTVSLEIARIVQKIFGLLLIALLFFSNQLTLSSLFFYNYFILAFLGITIILILERKGYAITQSFWLSTSKFKEYFNEFYRYSHPLFLFSVVALLSGILDRWLLQYFSGSVEQGFYGLSYLIGSACFVFTSAMTPLIWREFSIAYGKKDFDHMSHLFRRYVPLLYSIAATIACFIAIQAEKVIQIMGGQQYSGALWSLFIMAFYPIHQTYGQLSGAVCMAADQTGLYSKIGIVFMFIGIPVGYVLIAPENRMGFNAGATGLAIKMVIMQIISVNVQLYFNCRLLRLNFRHYVIHQILSVFIFMVFSVAAMLFVDRFLVPQNYILINFLISGIVYFCMVMGLLYFTPSLSGLDRKDMSLITHLVIQLIKKMTLSYKQ